MGSGIQNLDRESLLMLYAAGELSNGQLKRMEEMLANDASLRAELEQVVAAQEAMTASFSAADAQRPLPAPVSSSVRRLSSSIAQWHVNRLRAQSIAPVRNARKLGWLYGTASVAAAAIVVIFVLWSRVDDGKAPVDIFAEDNAVKTDTQQADAPEVAVAPDPDDYTPAGGALADMKLTRAEGELDTLSTLTDSMRSIQDSVTP